MDGVFFIWLTSCCLQFRKDWLSQFKKQTQDFQPTVKFSFKLKYLVIWRKFLSEKNILNIQLGNDSQIEVWQLLIFIHVYVNEFFRPESELQWYLSMNIYLENLEFSGTAFCYSFIYKFLWGLCYLVESHEVSNGRGQR